MVGCRISQPHQPNAQARIIVAWRQRRSVRHCQCPTGMSVLEAIVTGLMAKSGATEWKDSAARAQLIVAINEIVEGIELMAASKQLITEMDGTPKQIVFADHAGDFNPTAANDLRKTTDGTHEL